MIKKNIIILLFIGLVGGWSIYAHAQSGNGKMLLFMSPDDIAKNVEVSQGKKRVLVLMQTKCETCHKKFLGILGLEKEDRDNITVIFHSQKILDFKRYMTSFNEVPILVVYNRDSQYELMKALRKYGVKPWKSLPRVILIDENNQVYGQGNHSADKIAQFLSLKTKH